MAGISCLYDATVFRTVDGQLVSSEEQVDLLNLGALAFDKIVINADVDLGNGKGASLPDFSNVEINGEFDCSRFAVTAESVLPRGITCLKCFYSLSSLDVLAAVLPDTVSTVYVRNAVINSVQKESKNLQMAQDFIGKYPKVVVIGKTDTLRLHDVIAQIELGTKAEKVKKADTPKNQVISQTKEEPVKRKGYFSIAEAADELKKMPAFSGMPPKEIRKQLKTFLYNNSDNPMWGNVQNYVKEDAIKDLAYELLNQEKEEKPKEEAIDPKNNTQDSKQDNKVVEVKVPEKAESGSDLKPIEIKKFFDKRVWASVCKAVNGNKDKLIKFLNNISDVNLNPIQKDMRVGAGRIACLKGGELKLVPNLELKNSCYIAQGFGRSNNRPRVIYCVLSGGELVAASYFANHGDGKNKCAYNSAILTNALRDKTAKSFAENRQNYIDVDDLMKDFSRDEDEPSTIVHEAIPLEPVPVIEQAPVVEQKVEHTKAEQPKAEQTIEEKPVAIVTPKPVEAVKERPVIETKILEKPKAVAIVKLPEAPKPEPVQQNVVIKPVEEKVIAKPEKQPVEPPKFSNEVLYQVNYEFDEVFNIINEEILDIKRKLMAETDTNNSLKLASQLSEKLKDKQLIEQNIEIAKKTFNMIKSYMNKSYSEKSKQSL